MKNARVTIKANAWRFRSPLTLLPALFENQERNFLDKKRFTDLRFSELQQKKKNQIACHDPRSIFTNFQFIFFFN